MTKNKIIELFEKVQKIPYYLLRHRDSKKIFELNKGYCSEKNIWLGNEYKKMGLKVKYYLVKFRWEELPIPKDILNLFDEKIHYHLAMKVKLDGEWIWVDPTWDPELEKAGFPVTKNWNGKSDTKLAVKPLEIKEYEPQDPTDTNIKKEFMDEFNNYLEKIRGHK
ncbi:MAG: hypothetical protein ISS48_01110 [Candidatus Aenigmarchaeota archaeon]|nr:hypothetical protein [Candidatus Aenigmarchaeota archaeon]